LFEQAASKRMVREGINGKIVFVASVLAYFGLAGYSPYTPGKFAIRGRSMLPTRPRHSESLNSSSHLGLAESLRSELLLYSISVQIVFPGTIFTPGYNEENTTKPAITLKLESTDGGMSPEGVAQHMLKGVVSGKFHITYDFIGHVFRASSRGSSPGNGGLLDQAYALIGAVSPLYFFVISNDVADLCCSDCSTFLATQCR
jgi:3-dehydrosphinganine reductase